MQLQKRISPDFTHLTIVSQCKSRINALSLVNPYMIYELTEDRALIRRMDYDTTN